MGKYIGQREICKRLKTENHQLPKLNDMIYTKYEGTEWLDDRYIHITCQSCGDWLMITYKNEKKTDLYVGYEDTNTLIIISMEYSKGHLHQSKS